MKINFVVPILIPTFVIDKKIKIWKRQAMRL